MAYCDVEFVYLVLKTENLITPPPALRESSQLLYAQEVFIVLTAFRLCLGLNFACGAFFQLIIFICVKTPFNSTALGEYYHFIF